MNKDIRILVVDDFKSMRSLIRSVLMKLGFKNVIEADDGASAWRVLNEEPVDLVISDWNMPQVKGIDLLRKVRESEQFRTLPFLMVTAEGFKENVIEAVKAGVSGYIVKPFSPGALEDKLQKILAKSG
ncbi:MAG: response regulator [Desulfovibrionaceae bacterium]